MSIWHIVEELASRGIDEKPTQNELDQFMNDKYRRELSLTEFRENEEERLD